MNGSSSAESTSTAILGNWSSAIQAGKEAGKRAAGGGQYPPARGQNDEENVEFDLKLVRHVR